MPNPATYTPTTWVSGSTPADAPELNNIEDGLVALYANTPQTGGNNTFTGLQSFQVTLSGADKVLQTWKATDGKQYSWYERSSGNIALHNDTDGLWLLEIDKHDGALNPSGTTIYVGTTDPATVTGNTVSEGDLWVSG